MEWHFGSIFSECANWLGLVEGCSPLPPKSVPLRILGLSEGATAQEIRSAFRATILAIHPDLRPAFENHELQKIAQEGRGSLPDVQELVWARDCALRQVPRETDTYNPDGPMRKDGKMRVCKRCGVEIQPPRLREYNERQVLCEDCASKGTNRRILRRCAHCGVWMWGAAKNVRYCSTKCRMAFGFKRKRELLAEKRAERTCPVCGKRFTPRRSDGLFCSTSCRVKGFRSVTPIKHT